MELLVSILVLGVLVFVHELGHFLLAKFYGVGVLEFAIGFGKPIWRKRFGQTNYSVRMIPLGGFVRMVGDDPRLLTPDYPHLSQTPQAEKDEGDHENAREIDPVEQELLKDESKWFLRQRYFPKFMIVLAGPAFNVFFAIFAAIYSCYIFGMPVAVDEPIIGATLPGYPAEKAGLLAGDRILNIDGTNVTTWSGLAKVITSSAGRELLLDVEREVEAGKEVFELRIAGQEETGELAILEGREKSGSVKIGIVPHNERKEIGFGRAVLYGTEYVYFLSDMTIRGLWGMIRGAISPKNIGGPIFIFQEAAKNVKRGTERLLDFMIFLSVSLAILNLLPIPILDGGHLFFFTIEALKGTPVSLRVQEVANQVGMAILLLLMAFAVSNDIWRLVQ